MATPVLTRHVLPGALDRLLVDVRTGDRQNARPAVVVMHGFKGFKDWGMFPVLAERLARAGFSAISFNVSGSGVDDLGDFSLPDNFGRNTYTAELDDLVRVVDGTRRGSPLGIAPPTSVGLVGHSRGGGMAVLAAAKDPGLAALVTWAPIGSVDRWSDEAKASWRKRGFVNIQNARTGQVIPLKTDVLDDIARNAAGTLDIAAAARKVAVPWLIVHGENDESVDVEDGRMLAQASHRETTRLLLIPDAGHTFGATHPLKDRPPAMELAIDETVRFLGHHLA